MDSPTLIYSRPKGTYVGKDAENILYFRELLGSPAKGRCGLGYIPRVPLAPKGTKEHRKAVCDTLFEVYDKQLLDDTIQKYANASAAKGSSHNWLLCSCIGHTGVITSGMTCRGRPSGQWVQT